jgi:hypothetical protein
LGTPAGKKRTRMNAGLRPRIQRKSEAENRPEIKGRTYDDNAT